MSSRVVPMAQSVAELDRMALKAQDVCTWPTARRSWPADTEPGELEMTVDNIKLGETQTLRVVRSSTEALELESTWQPGGTPPRTHWHPHQHEHFEVLVGE